MSDSNRNTTTPSLALVPSQPRPARADHATMEALMDDDRPATPYRFPPIPLLSGDTVENTPDGDDTITEVAVTITTEHGHTVTVPLTPRYGGWWPPDALPEDGNV